MNIVTGGCSFSNTEDCVDYTTHGMNYNSYQLDNYKSWALHLEDIVPDCKVYNTAKPAAGNGYISRAVIYKVNELLEQYKKPDYVFIQLTSCDRKELLVNIDDYPPVLCLSALKLSDERLMLCFKAYGQHLEFWCMSQMLAPGQKQVSEQWSGGLTVFAVIE